jgi:hypothetical protein
MRKLKRSTVSKNEDKWKLLLILVGVNIYVITFMKYLAKCKKAKDVRNAL